jgi:hypothetical protein
MLNNLILMQLIRVVAKAYPLLDNFPSTTPALLGHG